VLTLAALFLFGQWRESQGYNRGAEDGRHWQESYAFEITSCMQDQEESFVDWRRKESPGLPLELAREDFLDPIYHEAARYACQNTVVSDIGEPPSKSWWE